MYITKAKHSQSDYINHFIRKTLLVDYPDEVIKENEFINDHLFWTTNLDEYNLYLLFDDGTLTGFYNFNFYDEKSIEFNLFIGKFDNFYEYKVFLIKDFLDKFGGKYQIYSIIDRNEKDFFESYGFMHIKHFGESVDEEEITMKKSL